MRGEREGRMGGRRGCSPTRGVPTPPGGHRLEHLWHGGRGWVGCGWPAPETGVCGADRQTRAIRSTGAQVHASMSGSTIAVTTRRGAWRRGARCLDAVPIWSARVVSCGRSGRLQAVTSSTTETWGRQSLREALGGLRRTTPARGGPVCRGAAVRLVEQRPPTRKWYQIRTRLAYPLLPMHRKRSRGTWLPGMSAGSHRRRMMAGSDRRRGCHPPLR